MSRIIAVTLSALIFAGCPALAQTTATDPAADRTFILRKADENVYVKSMLEQFVNSGNSGSRGFEQLIQRMGDNFGINGDFKPPYAYRDAMNFRNSQVRAQTIGQILVADFNNDGDIAKSELKAMLQFDLNNVAAAAFFSSDADDNGILSAAEVRDAAVLAQRRNGNNPDTSPERLGEAFDFDDDGMLTAEELDRVKAALGL